MLIVADRPAAVGDMLSTVNEPPLPPAETQCAKCGEDLGGSYWIHDRHLRMHLRCIPWHEGKWPYDEHVRLLLRVLRANRYTEEGRVLAQLLTWLRKRERAWPSEALDTVVEFGRRLRALPESVKMDEKVRHRLRGW